MKIFISEDFSCDFNYQYDYIRNNLERHFILTEDISEADIVVFAGTCACTENKINYIGNYINKCISKMKKDAISILTGCFTRPFKDEEFSHNIKLWMDNNIDYIIPHNEPNLILQTISDIFSDRISDAFGACFYSKEDGTVDFYVGNGCLNNCAFCKVTYQSYPLKSLDLESIKYFIDFFNESEFRKVTLIATNLSQCGLDLYNKPILPEIIELIEKQPNIKQLDISGLAFKDAIKYHLEDALALSTKLNTVFASLETASNRLLEMIKKGYTKEEVIDFIRYISRFYPRNFVLTIISGLPTETIDDIKETLNILSQIKPDKVTICEYQHSRFLPLDALPQLSKREKRHHTKIYNEVLTRKRIPTSIIK